MPYKANPMRNHQESLMSTWPPKLYHCAMSLSCVLLAYLSSELECSTLPVSVRLPAGAHPRVLLSDTLLCWLTICHEPGAEFLVFIILIRSVLTNYPGGCLGHSLYLSMKTSLSVQCRESGINYTSQILQSCSKLDCSFRHLAIFNSLFKLRN